MKTDFFYLRDITVKDIKKDKMYSAELKEDYLATRKKLDELERRMDVETAEFNRRVIDIAKTEGVAYRKKWESLVKEEDLVDNIVGILDMSLYALQDPELSNEKVAKNAKALVPGSNAWREFVFNLISALHKNGSFGTLKDGFDSFNDTAGGCDETVWEASMKLLK